MQTKRTSLRPFAALVSIALALGVIVVSAFAQTQNGPFPDVPASHPHAGAIAYMKEHGIIQGYADGNFKPENTINRVELIKILIESQYENSPGCSKNFSYTDVDWSSWYATPLKVASCLGIVNGYPDSTFKPANPVNAVETFKIVAGGFTLEVIEGIDVWYEPYVERLAEEKAIPTDIASLNEPLTRGEVAEIIYRLHAGIKNKASRTAEELLSGNLAASTPATASNRDYTQLPLGDDKVSSSPKKGYIYSCQTSFNGGGADTQGPWINTQTNTWDLTNKIQVDGSVLWPNHSFSITAQGDQRVITSNNIPEHRTGMYPISTTDDAYQYDRNPNSISQQSLEITLPKNPVLLSSPQCIGGEAGIMLTGIPLLNGFDAGGRDAVATEIQDACSGHPQEAGQYHYHGPSDCVPDNSASTEHSDLEGYALDGFGIFGIKGESGAELSSNDLDECHGHTHTIEWDGQTKSMYHYHLTHDFPYSVSCFRAAKAVSEPLVQGGQGGAPSGTGGGPNQGPPPPRPPY